MTLIVGIKCTDGVVVGADGAATYGAPLLGQKTIQQPTSKLFRIGSNLILGTSGTVGLAQSYQLELEEAVKKTGSVAPWKTLLDARNAIHSLLWKHTKPAWEEAQVVAQTVGPQMAFQTAYATSVVALPIAGEPHLIQFDHQNQPEHASIGLPFVAIGSGQQTADPFLAFLRRVFWPDALPSLADGRLAVVWTIQHANTTIPGGVGDPIQVMELHEDAGKWKAMELTADQLAEVNQMIELIEENMKEAVFKTLAEQPTAPIPE